MQESNIKICSDNIEMAKNIFNEYGDYIRSVICFQIKNETIADDLFQDFFLWLVTRTIPEGEKISKRQLRDYLYRGIAINATDSFHKTKRYQSMLQKYTEDKKSMLEAEPETVLMAADETENMFRIIRNSLSQKEASAVTLRYKDNYNTKEIADKMGLNPSTVSRYIYLGLKKLRQVFKVSGEESQPATASAKKAEERSAENIERLVLNVSVSEFSPEDEVAEGIVELYRALSAYYIASEGRGLVIDDWKNLVSDGVPAEVPS